MQIGNDHIIGAAHTSYNRNFSSSNNVGTSNCQTGVSHSPKSTIPVDGQIMKGRMTKEQPLEELKEIRRQLQLLDSCRQEMQFVQAKYGRLHESAMNTDLEAKGR